VQEALLTVIHAAHADLADLLRARAGIWPPMPVSISGPWPHRQATGMPWMLPDWRHGGGVEVGVGVEPQHAQLATGLAAVPGHRADRADRQAVIAAEHDRHAPSDSSA
jgi:hypothetical protein